jgi:hypothetical protein
VVVGPGATHCYAHDPGRAEERKRNASRGGRSKGGGTEIADLKGQLRKLAADVLSGEVGRSEAAVVNQILNTRARLIELERKIKEAEELEARMEALEDVLKTRRTG